MKENTRLPLVLILALPILLLISTEVADISFNLMGEQIYLFTFIFPLTFLVSALISKKAESRVAITLVIVSLIMQCFMFVIKWVLIGTVNYVLMEVTFLGFFMSQLLLLLGFETLKEMKKSDKFGYLFFVLLISTLIETMFYLSVFSGMTIISIIITFAIKIVYDLIIAKILSK